MNYTESPVILGPRCSACASTWDSGWVVLNCDACGTTYNKHNHWEIQTSKNWYMQDIGGKTRHETIFMLRGDTVSNTQPFNEIKPFSVVETRFGTRVDKNLNSGKSSTRIHIREEPFVFVDLSRQPTYEQSYWNLVKAVTTEDANKWKEHMLNAVTLDIEPREDGKSWQPDPVEETTIEEVRRIKIYKPGLLTAGFLLGIIIVLIMII